MDLSYKFPLASAEKMTKIDRISYMPIHHGLIFKFKKNKITSPLLRLPAELRIKIWQHTLGGNRILPPGIIPSRDDFSFCPSSIYIFAEPYENMRHFLSLLYVCRQIYHEARLFPFSCNIWEFWMTNNSYRKDPWLNWMTKINLAQYHAIEWILIGGRRWSTWRDEERPRDNVQWASIASLKGVKVIIRRLPMHEIDVQKLDDFAKQMGCRVIDEETVELTGVYASVPRRGL